jgi:hypothetical protein
MAFSREPARRCGGVRGEIFDDGESGHGEDFFVAHQLHGLGREVICVIDAGDPGLSSVLRAGFAGAMHANARSGALSFSDSRGEFGFGVLVGRSEDVAYKAVASGLVNLGEVGAFLALLAHDGDDLSSIVGEVGVG